VTPGRRYARHFRCLTPALLDALPYGKGVVRLEPMSEGNEAATGGRIDMERLIVLRPIKNQRRGASG
jgi:hypothetical protein